MCKFSNHLFVFTLLCLLLQQQAQWIKATPVLRQRDNSNLLAELLTQDYDYDLHYDQRQKGSENLRLKLDGFLIGLPGQEENAGLTLLTDDLLENFSAEILLGMSKSGSTTSSPDNLLNSYNKHEQLIPPAKPSSTPGSAEAIIVEIPGGAKRERDFESRQHVEQQSVAKGGGGSRTKFHIFHLLNFLRGNKRF